MNSTSCGNIRSPIISTSCGPVLAVAGTGRGRLGGQPWPVDVRSPIISTSNGPAVLEVAGTGRGRFRQYPRLWDGRSAIISTSGDPLVLETAKGGSGRSNGLLPLSCAIIHYLEKNCWVNVKEDEAFLSRSATQSGKKEMSLLFSIKAPYKHCTFFMGSLLDDFWL